MEKNVRKYVVKPAYGAIIATDTPKIECYFLASWSLAQ